MQQPEDPITGVVVKKDGKLYLQDSEEELWWLHPFDLTTKQVDIGHKVTGRGFVYAVPVGDLKARIEVGTLQKL